ncbi:MAG: hypothetical protein J6W41_01435 [Alphaproteobacteria bacterium]|nr:hypothetical protein [Alphaproteobacteria bacterium]
MQKLFGFKKIGALSVAGLVSFVAIDARADATCGVNLFNPMILTEADFTLTQRNNGEYDATGSWEHLNTYVSNYPFNFIPNKAYKVSYEIECPEEENESVGNTYLTFKLSDGSFVVSNTNACANVTPGQVVTVVLNMPSDQTAVGMAVRNVAGTNVSGHGFKISNVMVALSNQSGFVSYNPCIKLATTKMTETRMAAVENRLTGVRNKINTLITQMQTNSNGIGNLQTEKQTRPNASCPVDKKCLLVKDRDNNDNWYEIKDCNEDAFLSDVGNAVGDGVCGASGFAASDIGCTATDNWVSTYNDGAVFGVAKSVSVTEGQGQIVTLDGVSTTGRQCACRITGYNPKDQSGNYTGAVSVTTSKWMLTGVMNYDTDAACVAACARAGLEGAVFSGAADYYQNVGNDCYGSASNATACNYNRFIQIVISNGQRGAQGSVGLGQDYDSDTGTYLETSTQQKWSACATGGTYASNTHCTTNGDWITEYTFNGGSDSGYVWGTGRYATVPAGTSIGDIVNVSALSNVSVEYNNNTNINAVICTINGYKSYESGATEQTINSGLAVVYRIDDQNFSLTGHTIGSDYAATACAEWVGGNKGNPLYNALICPVVANN